MVLSFSDGAQLTLLWSRQNPNQTSCIREFNNKNGVNSPNALCNFFSLNCRPDSLVLQTWLKSQTCFDTGQTKLIFFILIKTL